MRTSFHVDRIHWRHPAYPRDRPPLRIVFLSDLHCSGPGDRFREVARWLAGRHPDVVLFGGDYQDGHGRVPDRIYTAILGVLGSARARWGVYGVAGNHDHPEFLARLGREPCIRILENDWVHLDGDVYLVGIGDAWQDRDDARRAVAGIPSGSFVLAVAHSPDAAPRAALAGVHALFCGHTHGGQVVLPLVGAPIKRLKRDRRLLSGEFRLNRLLLHVTTGFGSSLFSIRMGTRPSVCEATIEHGTLAANRVHRIFPRGFWTRGRRPRS